MAFAQSVSPIRSLTLALQGLLFTAVLIVFSQLDIRFGSLTVPFVSVALIGIFIWPRGADSALSALFIFACGLWLDVLSGGLTGMWTVFFVLTFVVTRPNRRSRETKMNALWAGFALWWMVIAILYFVVGAISSVYSAAWQSVIIEMIVSLVMFPIVYGLSQFARQFSTGGD